MTPNEPFPTAEEKEMIRNLARSFRKAGLTRDNASLRWYILDERGEPRLPKCHASAMVWFEKRDRRVARTYFTCGSYVSTVFLGMDHGWGQKQPVLWETLAFDPEGCMEDTMDRCSGTREQALAMHQRAVNKFLAMGAEINHDHPETVNDPILHELQGNPEAGDDDARTVHDSSQQSGDAPHDRGEDEIL